MTVWIVYHGNYFPREVHSIWSTYEKALEASDGVMGLNVEEWEVDSKQ